MKSHLELLHEGERKARFGIDALQVDKISTPREMLDSQLNQELSQKDSEHLFYKQRISDLKSKFGIKGNSLECEGNLGRILANNEKTLEQAMNDDARQRREAGKFHLATARTTFQGRPMRLFFEIAL